MTKHTIHLVNSLNISGSGGQALDLQSRIGPKCLVAALSGSLMTAEKTRPGLMRRGRWLRFSPSQNEQFGFYSLYSMLKRNHVHTLFAHDLTALHAALFPARLAGVSSIYGIVNSTDELNRKAFRIGLGLRMRSSTVQILVGNIASQNALRTYWPNLPCKTLKPGVDLQRFQPGNKIAARKKVNIPIDCTLIGTALTLEKGYGLEKLLEALFRLPASTHLAIAGQGEYLLHFQSAASELGIGHRVHFLGWQPESALFYQALDLFCQPKQTFSHTLLEAQACGIPVVAMNRAGCDEACCPITGYLAEPDSATSLAETVKQALSRQLTRSPRLHMEQHHDMNKMFQALRAR
ncbi:MAG: glycosyltransferase [Magnetococcales bacterium]|nr:glycosyltransferase [Magnetococcales bacterium]